MNRITATILLALTFVSCSKSQDPGTATADHQRHFSMIIEDVFSTTDRGILATGQIDSGSIQPHQTVYLYRGGKLIRELEVLHIEAFSEPLNFAQKGQKVGIALDVKDKSELHRKDHLRFP